MKDERCPLWLKRLRLVVFIVLGAVVLISLAVKYLPGFPEMLKNWDWNFNLNWGWKGWTILGMILSLIPILYLFLYSLGKAKIILTFAREGEIETRIRGESFLGFIPNIQGYGLVDAEINFNDIDSDGKVLKTTKIETKKICPVSEGGKPIKKIFGLSYVGIFIPFDKILSYTFSWDKAITKTMAEEEKKKGASVEEAGFGDLWISHRTEKVFSLYFRYTYPVIVKNIELAGRYPIDISFNVTVEAVYPIIPIFYLKGKWFIVLVSIFNGIVSDLQRGEELETFEKKEKESFFNEKVKARNDLFLSTTGMKVFNVAYRDYQPSGSPDEKKAASAKKLATFNADALKEKAEGEGAEIERVGEANAKTLRRLLEEAMKHPLGAQVLIEQTRARAIENFKGSVLSQGQNPLQFTVDAEKQKRKDGEEK